MSRLTERFGQNATTKEPCYVPAGIGTEEQVVLSEIVDKLGRLEDLEEAGRLIVSDYNEFKRDKLDRCTHRHCNKCDGYRRKLAELKGGGVDEM